MQLRKYSRVGYDVVKLIGFSLSLYCSFHFSIIVIMNLYLQYICSAIKLSFGDKNQYFKMTSIKNSS